MRVPFESFEKMLLGLGFVKAGEFTPEHFIKENTEQCTITTPPFGTNICSCDIDKTIKLIELSQQMIIAVYFEYEYSAGAHGRAYELAGEITIELEGDNYKQILYREPVALF